MTTLAIQLLALSLSVSVSVSAFTSCSPFIHLHAKHNIQSPISSSLREQDFDNQEHKLHHFNAYNSLTEREVNDDDDDDSSFLLAQALSRAESDSQSSSNADPFLQLIRSPSSASKATEPASSSSWYYDLATKDQALPFDCTGCGKCCKTKGEVYLSPLETMAAARSLNITLSEFKHQYVDREEDMKDRPNEGVLTTGWTVLKQQQQEHEQNPVEGSPKTLGSACIFLGEDNLCKIYDARPLQCSTYPFWPRIMDSREVWNAEVVSRDAAKDNNKNQSTMSKGIEKYWSYEKGGCEGMKKIDEEGRIISTETIANDSTTDVGVTIRDATDRLDSYTRYKRRFPVTSQFRPIQKASSEKL